MKRIVLFCLIISLVICGLPFSSNATDIANNVFYYDNETIEIIIDNTNNQLTKDRIEYIANDLYSLYSVDSGIAVADEIPLMCKLFGHNEDQTTAMLVEHYYYSTSPYCREIVYNVWFCTRNSCPYKVMVFDYEERTIECHG